MVSYESGVLSQCLESWGNFICPFGQINIILMTHGNDYSVALI